MPLCPHSALANLQGKGSASVSDSQFLLHLFILSRAWLLPCDFSLSPSQQRSLSISAILAGVFLSFLFSPQQT
ncbi:uncharacterized protein G2W53_035951 [Senna tora]|uniref:Uncharacterized protein n=1 Tax=Senna tora TaxID=362788 RepID=A0A834W5H0_9FABA|nr:uncharacterized protein G2W53_035951 [Senna tora]